MTAAGATAHAAAADAPRGLWNRGFVSLLATQFFEASSDNVIKGTLTFAVAQGSPWHESFGAGGNGTVAVAFVLPFILLSAFGGRIADRCSKSRVTIVLKAISLGVAAFTAVVFAQGSPWGALAALLAFSTVSAFFGPVKYGMIAELVEPAALARANGIVNMATIVAVIVGMVVAGIVSHHWKQGFADGAPSGTAAWLPGLAMGAAVTLGFLTCLTLPYLRPQKPDLPVDLNPFATYVTTLREMSRGPLLGVAFAWTFFYFVAAMVLVILPDYSAFLHVTDEETSYLMAALAVAIGTGCVLAAYLDAPRRRTGFIGLGAAGMAAGFAALGFAGPHYGLTMVLLVVTGALAGFYIIPLQAMLQSLAPDESRGRVLGTANGMSFVMGGVGSGLFIALAAAGVPSNRSFLALAAACVVPALLAWRASVSPSGPVRPRTPA